MKYISFDPRRYLFFKIFLWFWITILATISLAFFLSNISASNVSSEPLEGPMAKNIQHLASSIERMAEKTQRTVQEIVSHPRMVKQRLTYITTENADESFFNQAIPDNIDISLINFSRDLRPQFILTEHYHAFGPVKLTVKNKEYLFYEIQIDPKPHFILKLKLMPLWLKLVIALGASLTLSLLFTKTLMQPINALKQAAGELAQGQLKSRVSSISPRHDELGELTAEFNKMAEKLELLVTGQKRLLADISHELRSPLTRLQMAAGLAQMQSSPNALPYIQRIEQEAENLDKMIADVLTLSRLEAQSHTLFKELNDINSVLGQVISDAEFEAKQHGKSLICQGKVDCQFSFDAKSLASALENVLRNAIKYATSEVNVTVKQQNDTLFVVICDDGPGVPDEYLTAIFEPFFRVSQARDRNSGGTGLGLAISKHAIEAHQGSIHLSNQPNAGLCVTITLPLES